MGEKSAYGVDSTFLASTKAESGVRTEAKSSLRDVQGGRSFSFAGSLIVLLVFC